jgi:hypothetical protein
MPVCRRRAGVITKTQGVCRFQLAPGPPLPLKMENQLRIVMHVPNVPLDTLLVNEMMERRGMEQRLTVTILVRLIAMMIIASSLTHSLTVAFSGSPFKSSLFLL